MQNAKPRILFVITQSDWGGAQTYVLNTAKEAMHRGYDVFVAAGGHDDLAKQCYMNSIPHRELFKLKRNLSPLADIAAIAELVGLMREWKPDIAYLHSSKASVIGSIAARIAGVKRVIYRIGGWSFLDPVSPIQKQIRLWSEKLTARFKDTIIVLHPGDEALAAQYGIRPKKHVLMIPNGMDLSTFDKRLLSPEEARKRLNPPPNPLPDWNPPSVPPLSPPTAEQAEREACYEGNPSNRALPALREGRGWGKDSAPLILTVANFYPAKDLLGYLDAVALVHKEKPDVRFIIIGDGEKRAALEEKRHALGLDDVMSLPGKVSDVATLLRGADLFVLPSAKEGMPWALLEAMAAEIPCVATNVGACKWMLGTNSGWIVPPQNPKALAAAILDALADLDEAKRRAERARLSVQQRFDAKRMFDEIFKEIEDRA